MAAFPPPTAENCDVFVVGAGLAGAAAAIGFARAGFSVFRAARSIGSARAARSRCWDDRSTSSRTWASGTKSRTRPRRCARCASSTTRARCSRRGRSNSMPGKSNSKRSAGTSRTRDWRIFSPSRSRPRRIWRASRPRSRPSTSPASTPYRRRRRAPLRRAPCRRRGRTRFERAQGGGHRRALASLWAERADDVPRAYAAPRRFLDRVPHAARAVHAGSPARFAPKLRSAPAWSG